MIITFAEKSRSDKDEPTEPSTKRAFLKREDESELNCRAVATFQKAANLQLSPGLKLGDRFPINVHHNFFSGSLGLLDFISFVNP